MTNNTIANNQCTLPGASATAAGILAWSGSSVTGTNNISYGNSSANNSNYAGTMTMTYSCSTPLLTGTGNIANNPLFVNPIANNFTLMSNSPCIDAGNPASPLDPDGTVADMGYQYFDQNFAADIMVALTPYSPPIQVPANGGQFSFNIAVTNNEAVAVTFTVWTTVTMPTGGTYGPIINAEVTLPGGITTDRDRNQSVPGTAPSGNYIYNAYVGIYPSVIFDEDHFIFTKLATEDGGLTVDGWNCYGQGFEEQECASTMSNLRSFELLCASPNPFNAQTKIEFSLNEGMPVKLQVFDIGGRVVSTLTDGYLNPGLHSAVFHAGDFASGIYFYRLTAGKQVETRKLVMVK